MPILSNQEQTVMNRAFNLVAACQGREEVPKLSLQDLFDALKEYDPKRFEKAVKNEYGY